MAKKKSSEKAKKDLAKKIEKDISRVVEKIAGPGVTSKINKTKKKIPYFYITVAFVIALLGVFAYAMLRSPEAEIGDKVKVSFRGVFENGTLFAEDTTEFRLGEGQVMLGLESLIYGMKEGEEKKNAEVSSRYCFGEWTTDALEIMDANYSIKRFIDINLEELKGKTNDTIEINNTIRLKNEMWFYRITDIDRSFGEARLEQMPLENSIYYNPLITWWPVRVIDVQEAVILLRHEPLIGAPIAKKVNGQRVQGTVIKADKEKIVIDYNNPHAGKFCYFDVKVEEITKK